MYIPRLAIVPTIAALSLLGFPTETLGAVDFVGPFPSWKNVKTDYGAVGDGKTDDTAAFQKALTDLQFHKDFCVLYVPAGTYRITETVKTVRKAHTDGMGISILGEDPATTVLRWDGPKGGILLQFAAWYSRIGRLTLHGNNKARAALAYGEGFSTYNETADMIFRDATTGLSLGVGKAGQAENAVLRCQFLRCGVGIRTTNFNSLDIWAWHCLFENCGYGLYNNAGNFHAYFNVFKRSKTADIGTANLAFFAFHGNTSLNSKCFLDFRGGHSWSSPTSITGNRIYHPTGGYAIRLGNGGPYLVMDNIIRALPTYTGPLVEMTWGNQTFIGNTYSTPRPVVENKKSRFMRLNEKIVRLETIDPQVPKLPPPPARRTAKVFEVVKGAGAPAIQRAIDDAAQMKGRKPVVHLPMGVYKIQQTIIVPAGCDVQLVGDGAAQTATVLEWTGPRGGRIFELKGPSRASLCDLHLKATWGSCVRVENADQPGGRILADQLMASGLGATQKGKAGLHVNGLESSDVLLRCSQGGYDLEKWVNVIGGVADTSGQDTLPRVTILTGASSTADAQYAVSKGGRVLVRSVYHEMSGKALRAIHLTDTGTLTIDTTRFSYRTDDKAPTIQLDGFRGRLALNTCLFLPVGTKKACRIVAEGNGSATKVLCSNSTFWGSEPGMTPEFLLENKASPPARVALLESNLNSQPKTATPKGFAVLPNYGDATAEFVLKMLEPIRRCPSWPQSGVQEGVTDVHMRRVMALCGQAGVSVDIRGKE
jgi:hypothetical protein